MSGAQMASGGSHRLIDRVKASIKGMTGRSVDRLILDSAPSVLDGQHRGGTWDYLGDLSEMARYAVIAGYCARTHDASSALDLGSGKGILLDWLLRTGITRYVGVDYSAAAIEAAKPRNSASISFVEADAAQFTPAERFNIIIFNEMLYYFERPDDIIRRYAGFLEPEGKFVISLWDGPESHTAWRRASRAVTTLDHARIANARGVVWDIRMCRPAG
jgi:2-polyprenyl-3-methyl-5-hydroxy-6-metoxy-1,4-benzoquinol methylase